ncbi:MAG: hypothetical protein H7A08_04815 [Oceanospirillaceae bacterium]|nr:hypothetical protein [Oceanospirillaceae bacterium]MCP5350046.1 hypothetical protein [Oceanospirillaceae bacterium]
MKKYFLLSMCLFFGANIALAGEVAATDVSKKDDEAKRQEIITQAEINRLVTYGGEYAYKLIKGTGGLSPFGVLVLDDGKVIVLEATTEQKKSFTFKDEILELRRLIKESVVKGNVSCAALFVSALVPVEGSKDQPGIAMEIEHKLGLSALRFVPYEYTIGDGELKLLKPVTKEKPVVFFAKAKAKAKK